MDEDMNMLLRFTEKENKVKFPNTNDIFTTSEL